MHLLHNLLLKSSSTLAVAESFTSGLLSSKISSVSGSSNYFKGGLVVYQNSVKSDILSVPMNIIMEKTEVSHEVAKEMAINTLKNLIQIIQFQQLVMLVQMEEIKLVLLALFYCSSLL